MNIRALLKQLPTQTSQFSVPVEPDCGLWDPLELRPLGSQLASSPASLRAQVQLTYDVAKLACYQTEP